MKAGFLVCICIRSVLFELFLFLGESMTATPIVIEVPIRSLVIVWLAFLVSVYVYLQ